MTSSTDPLMLNVFIVLATTIAGGVLMWPRLARARLWRAAVTPLASIIGSGFLVLGPILQHSYGAFAPLVMVALCLVAWLYGGAIRYNIATIDRQDVLSDTDDLLERAASWALAFAYVVSVAYYLNLFGSFAVSLTAFDDAFHAKLMASSAFVLILMIGWSHGFGALERVEQVFVSVKLAIIVGLLFGLGWFFAGKATGGDLIFKPTETTGIAAITLAFGLLITVQGFETSRYLAAEYDAATRIRSMRLAQLTATVIYLIYITFLTYSIAPSEVELTETAIISLMEIVAPVLPLLLIAAALSAQFSAAVADTSGSGGLMAELTHGRLTSRQSYALLVALGLTLTWEASVFEIIGYASRAFAIYYALQCLLATNRARQDAPMRATFYAALALLGFLIAIFGTSLE